MVLSLHLNLDGDDATNISYVDCYICEYIYAYMYEQTILANIINWYYHINK